MSSRCDVDLSPRSRSACSNCRIRARTDTRGVLRARAAPLLEEPSQGGRQVDLVAGAAESRLAAHPPAEPAGYFLELVAQRLVASTHRRPRFPPPLDRPPARLQAERPRGCALRLSEDGC